MPSPRLSPTLSVRSFGLSNWAKPTLPMPVPWRATGVAQVRDGRKVGSKLNVPRRQLDLQPTAEGQSSVERLGPFPTRRRMFWQEILVEDRHAGPADVAATRMDFNGFLESLPKAVAEDRHRPGHQRDGPMRRPGGSASRMAALARFARNCSMPGGGLWGEATDADDAAPVPA